MIIDEIDYYFNTATWALMTAAGDYLRFGVTISNGVQDLSAVADRRILHTGEINRTDFGAAASGGLIRQPFVAQFFPPLIVAERQLYLGYVSQGLGTAVTCYVRIYYRTVRLTESELLEITEVFRLVS